MGFLDKILSDGSDEGQAFDWLRKKAREKKARDAAAAQESEENAKSGLASLFGSDDEKKDE